MYVFAYILDMLTLDLELRKMLPMESCVLQEAESFFFFPKSWTRIPFISLWDQCPYSIENVSETNFLLFISCQPPLFYPHIMFSKLFIYFSPSFQKQNKKPLSVVIFLPLFSMCLQHGWHIAFPFTPFSDFQTPIAFSFWVYTLILLESILGISLGYRR